MRSENELDVKVAEYLIGTGGCAYFKIPSEPFLKRVLSELLKEIPDRTYSDLEVIQSLEVYC